MARARKSFVDGGVPALDALAEELLFFYAACFVSYRNFVERQPLAASAGGWLLGFALLYQLVRYAGLDEFQDASRAVGSLHALAVSAWSASVLVQGKAERAFDAPSNTAAATAVLCFSAGYFVYDTLGCLWHRDWESLLHHSASLFGILGALRTGTSGALVLSCIVLTECTGPCVNAMHFFERGGRKGDAVYFHTRLLFFATFIVMRVGLGPFLTWRLLATASAPLVVKVFH